jgi:hypothetical protein
VFQSTVLENVQTFTDIGHVETLHVTTVKYFIDGSLFPYTEIIYESLNEYVLAWWVVRGNFRPWPSRSQDFSTGLYKTSNVECENP